MTPLHHETSARKPRAALILLGVWLAILGLWVFLQAADWIVAVLLAFTAPAALDYARNRRAGLALDDTMLRWHSGRAEGEVALQRLEKVRFETRLDFSIRVRLVLDSGRRLSLPQDALPPWEELQQAFEARGIPTQRHHFVLM
ncbi:MAG: hypothetical protein N4A61_04380 [Pelagimonas sp.]|jgi:hypothetical protein|nr:hypothetical protein [Pelagimonas sp.]